MLCMDNLALEIQWAAGDTAAGNFSVDESNTAVTWYPTNSEVHNPTGAGAPSDNTLLNLNWVTARWVTLSYTNVSGSGTLTVTAIAKGIGG